MTTWPDGTDYRKAAADIIVSLRGACELALNALRCVYVHYDGKSKNYGPWPDICAAIAALEGK